MAKEELAKKSCCCLEVRVWTLSLIFATCYTANIVFEGG